MRATSKSTELGYSSPLLRWWARSERSRLLFARWEPMDSST